MSGRPGAAAPHPKGCAPRISPYRRRDVIGAITGMAVIGAITGWAVIGAITGRAVIGARRSPRDRSSHPSPKLG